MFTSRPPAYLKVGLDQTFQVTYLGWQCRQLVLGTFAVCQAKYVALVSFHSGKFRPPEFVGKMSAIFGDYARLKDGVRGGPRASLPRLLKLYKGGLGYRSIATASTKFPAESLPYPSPYAVVTSAGYGAAWKKTLQTLN